MAGSVRMRGERLWQRSCAIKVMLDTAQRETILLGAALPVFRFGKSFSSGALPVFALVAEVMHRCSDRARVGDGENSIRMEIRTSSRCAAIRNASPDGCIVKAIRRAQYWRAQIAGMDDRVVFNRSKISARFSERIDASQRC